MLTIAPDLRQRLKSQLIDEEGFRSKVYTDTRGVLTIGIGRSLSTNGITMDEALYLLDNDISRCEKELWHYAPWYADLDDVRKCVLLNMTFQLGIENVLNFREMISHIEKKDWDGAAKAMMDSSWDTQTPQRCHKLALAMETGSL